LNNSLFIVVKSSYRKALHKSIRLIGATELQLAYSFAARLSSPLLWNCSFAARLSSPLLPIFSSLSRSLLPKLQFCYSPFVAAVAKLQLSSLLKLQLASTLIGFEHISHQDRSSPHLANWSPFNIDLNNIFDVNYWAM